jgi:hypothetical protein
VFCSVGKIKFNTEKTPFFISPVYPVPPIIIVLSEKQMIAKFSALVLSTDGFALKFGAWRMVQSGSKELGYVLPFEDL